MDNSMPTPEGNPSVSLNDLGNGGATHYYLFDMGKTQNFGLSGMYDPFGVFVSFWINISNPSAVTGFTVELDNMNADYQFTETAWDPSWPGSLASSYPVSGWQLFTFAFADAAGQYIDFSTFNGIDLNILSNAPISVNTGEYYVGAGSAKNYGQTYEAMTNLFKPVSAIAPLDISQNNNYTSMDEFDTLAFTPCIFSYNPLFSRIDVQTLIYDSGKTELTTLDYGQSYTPGRLEKPSDWRQFNAVYQCVNQPWHLDVNPLSQTVNVTVDPLSTGYNSTWKATDNGVVPGAGTSYVDEPDWASWGLDMNIFAPAAPDSDTAGEDLTYKMASVNTTLSARYYQFSCYLSTDAIKNFYRSIDNADYYGNYYPLAELRIYDTDTNEPIAIKEIYTGDLNNFMCPKEVSIDFSLKCSRDVTLCVYTVGNSDMYLSYLALQSIPQSQYQQFDLLSYLNQNPDHSASTLQYDPNAVYVFPLQDFIAPIPDSSIQYDIIQIVMAFQGIVNRYDYAANGGVYDKGLYEPHLLVKFSSYPSLAGDLDDFWMGQLSQPGEMLYGKQMIYIDSFDELFKLFGNQINGLAVWDNDVPATSNVALTACGVHNLIPVRYSYQAGSLQDILENHYGFNEWLNLEGKFVNGSTGYIWGSGILSTGSAKDDAYLWAVGAYCNDVNHSQNVWHMDAFSWDPDGIFPTYYSAYDGAMLSDDYYISQRCFFWDLAPVTPTAAWPQYVPTDDPTQTPGMDAATLTAVLNVLTSYTKTGNPANDPPTIVNGFVPWSLKYSNASSLSMNWSISLPAPMQMENNSTAFLARFNCMLLPDGGRESNTPNLSAYTNVEQLDERGDGYQYTQPNDNKAKAAAMTNAQLDAMLAQNTTYCLLYYGDFDGSGWANYMFPDALNDPYLGEFPLQFMFTEMAYQQAPYVYNYLYEKVMGMQNINIAAADNGYAYGSYDYMTNLPKMQQLIETGLCQRYDIDTSAIFITQGGYGDAFGTNGYGNAMGEMYANLFPTGVMTFDNSCGPDPEYIMNSSGIKVPFHGQTYSSQGQDALYDTLTNYNLFPQTNGANRQSNSFVWQRLIMTTPTEIHNAVQAAGRSDVQFLDQYTFYRLYSYYMTKTGRW